MIVSFCDVIFIGDINLTEMPRQQGVLDIVREEVLLRMYLMAKLNHLLLHHQGFLSSISTGTLIKGKVLSQLNNKE